MSDLAMHISNGIIDGRVSGAAGAIAVGAVAAGVVRGRRDLDDRLAPMAGLVAAFIFSVQMLNFPVLPGVSGHLLGGALAAILVGPWVGLLCVSLVLVVQSLVFADGGITALGLNIVNMGLIGTFAAFGLVRLLMAVLPRTHLGIVVTSFLAATLSVVVASQGFVLEYALGGVTNLPLAGISGVMAGYHLLIGIGEGLITAVTVGTVSQVRPDLVYALRGRSSTELRLSSPAPAARGAA